MHVTAVVVAAGKGERLTSHISKQFINLKGKPILAYTLEKFNENNEINDIVLVTRSIAVDYCRSEIVEAYGLNKVKNIIFGGQTRQQSVLNGLKCCQNADIVLIHDGVRPFVGSEEISAVIEGSVKHGACAVGVMVKDTVKKCDKNNIIKSTLDRSKLWQIQTPQGFTYDLIMQAYKKAEKEGFIATDDCQIAEYAGHKCYITQGSYFNIKITTKEDLIFAEGILENLGEKNERN